MKLGLRLLSARTTCARSGPDGCAVRNGSAASRSLSAAWSNARIVSLRFALALGAAGFASSRMADSSGEAAAETRENVTRSKATALAVARTGEVEFMARK